MKQNFVSHFYENHALKDRRKRVLWSRPSGLSGSPRRFLLRGVGWVVGPNPTWDITLCKQHIVILSLFFSLQLLQIKNDLKPLLFLWRV